MTPKARTALAAAATVAVVALALALRFAHAEAVFAEERVGLGPDTDPHYHVLQAERILRGSPGAPWFDPNLDWPNGAVVPWPPLFDAGIALAARVAYGPDATREQIARVAAAAPPILGAISVLLVGALAQALFGGGGLLAAFLLAALDAHGEMTMAGRADQHALELVVAPALWLAFVLALDDGNPRRRRAATAAMAVLVALAFWAWMGSAFILAFPALGAVLLHLLDADGARRASRALALGGLGGAALLAASLAALGPPGALLRTQAIGLTGLHVMIAGGCGAFGALLLLARRLRTSPAGPARRAAEVAAALLLPFAGLLLASPGLRAGAAGGLVALRAKGAWYSDIAEFQPMIGTGHRPVGRELLAAFERFGLAPVAALAGLVVVALRARAARPRDGAAFVGALWGVVLVAFALARYRFMPYAALLVAALAGAALHWAWERLRRRSLPPGVAAAAIAIAAAVAVVPTYRQWRSALPRTEGGLTELLEWLGRQPPRPDGREGVAAMWDVGHAVQYYGRHPVLASPFGTEAGRSSLEHLAAFVFATEEDVAAELLRRRRVGYAIVGDPLPLVLDVRGFAPLGAPVVARITEDLARGADIQPLAGLLPLVVSRLAVLDGDMTPSGLPPLGTFRLLYESGPAGSPLKLFGTVEGARLAVEGARPGSDVTARVEVATNRGRTFPFTTRAIADAHGRAVLRVPYATGANGASVAGPAQVASGQAVASVPIPAAAVEQGMQAAVSLSPRSRR